MKTARFSNVAEKSGTPEPYIVLSDPKKDRTLQAAVKSQRVMTVMQETVGNKTDRGVIGFDPGPNRQFLIFPKSLHSFAGREVIGIKYELLATPPTSESKRPARPKSPKPLHKNSERASHPKKAVVKGEQKIIAFESEKKDADENEEVADLKRQVRRAMGLLEEGKVVAAFNSLKRILQD